MCGICGYVSRIKIPNDELEMMNNTMLHRGPDDAGVYVTEIEERYYGVAQRRLSILDLSMAGHQPMFTDDGTIGTSYNVHKFHRNR